MDVAVRPLREDDLPEADRIFRLAFGTFMGLSDPMLFAGDSDWTRSRWRTDPDAAFAAEVDGRLVGSNFVSNWGSVGFFGPLTVHPDHWGHGIAQRLLAPTMECFQRWGTAHAGLYTFAQSPQHAAIYQKFGFYPRFLTAIMSKIVDPEVRARGGSRFSEIPAAERSACLEECRALTGYAYVGLDVGREIRGVAAQAIGDTVLVRDGGRNLVGIGVCHAGRGSEAGSGTCYVKFGAVRPGPQAAQHFEWLLDASEALAGVLGAALLVAGVNLGCTDAYRTLRARHFRTDFQGVAMHRPNEPGYHRPDVYVVDDWR